MKHHLIPIQNQTAWDSAVSLVPHTFAHTHWYNRAMHLASQRDIVLYAGEYENFRIICPLSPRQKDIHSLPDVTTPYGFSGFACVGNYADFPKKWRQFMAGQFVCGHIGLHPFFNKDFVYSSSDLFSGKKTYFLDLNSPLEAIYKKFADGHKYELRHWEKSGLGVTFDKNEEVINAFINLYCEGLMTKQAAPIYNFGEAAWHIILSSPHTLLCSVQVEKKIEACAVFISYGEIADYYMMASTEKGRSYARGILWAAINYYHARKIRWLHLGCGIKENDSLEKFKARFGGVPYVTHALKQIYTLDNYETLCQKYLGKSGSLEGYFPEYWAYND